MLPTLVVCGLEPALSARAESIVNDVTQLNPITVRAVIAPTTLEQIADAVRTHPGPISIGGGRFSMGGQTATPGALQIDMRQFDQVIGFSQDQKLITVQAGITWRKVQEFIDPYGLSVAIMQSYNNFTVGGSLSVNVHGRYMGLGPVVMSVNSIRLVLADGAVVTASPAEHAELFYGAIGGYGGLGVIAEASLRLSDDVRVEEQSRRMPLSAYRKFFEQHVKDDPEVVFHNADIFPTAFDTVRVTSYRKTEKPVTITDRLHPLDADYRSNRRAVKVVSDWPGGKWLRQHVLDPWLYRSSSVEWRNYEASYDVHELEPASRRDSTYVLQEYFVPLERLEEFVPRMAAVLRRYHVNVINVSIRHARKDPGTLLAWAKSDVFCFVLYYKQGTSAKAQDAVRIWTRRLIDEAVAAGGSYYLPYQILATQQQFDVAYPHATEFFALKSRVDPANKFRNRLWDTYYHPGQTPQGSQPAPGR